MLTLNLDQMTFRKRLYRLPIVYLHYYGGFCLIVTLAIESIGH